MKTEKKKSKESLIGKIIYGFLLFMPLLSVLVTCLYVIQNENAHESYYGETINEKQFIDVTTNDNIDNNKTYYFNGGKAYNTEYSGNIYYTQCEYVTGLQSPSQEQLDFINNSVRLYYYRGTSINFYDSNNNSLVLGGTAVLKIDGLLRNPTSTNTFRLIKEVQYNKYSYLDDAFMYGLNKTEESQYFNWAKNTTLYTGVNEFTNTLGITTTYIPFLMTYWLLISVVYLIYDIALMMLHMAHNKIHQLEGSI